MALAITAAAPGSYLTGIQVKKTTIDIKASISCDQIIANQIGRPDRFVAGTRHGRRSPGADLRFGYSCAYTHNLAWRSDTSAAADARSASAVRTAVWRCAILTPEERAQQAKDRQSILDFVTADTKKLETSLGPTDRRKLDEYLSSIREVERQLEEAEKDNKQINPGMDKPYGVPADFRGAFQAAHRYDAESRFSPI